MAPDAILVEGHGISVVYRGRTVLDVPSMQLAAGETYVLLGASGAGKSTLLRILGLLERPTAGQVHYDGHVVARTDTIARRRIAAVFQKPYLLRGTVADNVGYGLRLRNVRGEERRMRIAAALRTVGLDRWEDRSALLLSGGEAQRVALARALVLRPNLLLLDEPLSYLDPLLKRELAREFADILDSEHLTTLYVTHDQDEARVVADRIGIMRDGRILTQGATEDVLTLTDDEWVASFLGIETALEGTAAESSEGVTTIHAGDLAVDVAARLEPGARVRIGVRPEDVVVDDPTACSRGDTPRNLFEGAVVGVTVSGVWRHVRINAQGHAFAALVSPSLAKSLGLAPGAAVSFSFRPDAVRVQVLS